MLEKYDAVFCILTKDLGCVSPSRLCRRVQRMIFPHEHDGDNKETASPAAHQLLPGDSSISRQQ